MSGPHGLIVLDKPAGVSSARALQPLKARGKVGHAGTLDPFATGILLALVGDATRLSALAMALEKTYLARVLFGRQTDTLDPEGEVVAEADPGTSAPRELEHAVRSLVGELDQLPPAYCALKVNGKRAYKLARAGRTPKLASRRVVVQRMRVTAVAWPEIELEIVCGTGTYVRALARDLGAALGLPACLSALRRTAIGPFDKPDAGRCLPPMALVEAAGLPCLELDADAALRFVTGRTVPLEAKPRERWAAVLEGRLVGLGTCDGTALWPASVLATARRQIETGTL